jgi:molybdopterin synthase sulfur carrier subunit
VPTIAFTPHLRKHLRCADGPFDGGTVRDVLESAFVEIPGLRGYLLDDRGRLRQHVAIFVGGRMIEDRITQQDPVAPESEIFVFQALSGG